MRCAATPLSAGCSHQLRLEDGWLRGRAARRQVWEQTRGVASAEYDGTHLSTQGFKLVEGVVAQDRAAAVVLPIVYVSTSLRYGLVC